MQVRFVQADVLELKDKLIVLKSDEADWEDVRAIRDSFNKAGLSNTMIVCLPIADSIETLSKERAVELLKYIIEGDKNEKEQNPS